MPEASVSGINSPISFGKARTGAYILVGSVFCLSITWDASHEIPVGDVTTGITHGYNLGFFSNGLQLPQGVAPVQPHWLIWQVDHSNRNSLSTGVHQASSHQEVSLILHKRLSHRKALWHQGKVREGQGHHYLMLGRKDQRCINREDNSSQVYRLLCYLTIDPGVANQQSPMRAQCPIMGVEDVAPKKQSIRSRSHIDRPSKRKVIYIEFQVNHPVIHHHF